MKTIHAEYIPQLNLFQTTLRGSIDTADVVRWQESIEEALAQIPDNYHFKAFVNIFGFEAADLEAHKAFRTVIPLAMSQYNFRVGYVDMFGDVELPLSKTRGISCVAFANVHHDEIKMKKYQDNYAKPCELFSTNVAQAREWLLNYPV